MNKLLLAASALLIGLTFSGSANAHERHSHPGSVRVTVGTPYFHDQGIRFSGGYFYRGNEHRHWEVRVWDEHCNRYHYYDPYLRCYYYWDPIRVCYYPVGW